MAHEDENACLGGHGKWDGIVPPADRDLQGSGELLQMCWHQHFARKGCIFYAGKIALLHNISQNPSLQMYNEGYFSLMGTTVHC